jgi:hypothetical protein
MEVILSSPRYKAQRGIDAFLALFRPTESLKRKAAAHSVVERAVRELETYCEGI